VAGKVASIPVKQSATATAEVLVHLNRIGIEWFLFVALFIARLLRGETLTLVALTPKSPASEDSGYNEDACPIIRGDAVGLCRLHFSE
jgi:hypothetical protein